MQTQIKQDKITNNLEISSGFHLPGMYVQQTQKNQSLMSLQQNNTEPQQWNTPQSVRKYYYQSNNNSVVLNTSRNQGNLNQSRKTPPSDKLTHLSSKQNWYNRQGKVKRQDLKKKISRLASRIAHQLDDDQDGESVLLKNRNLRAGTFVAAHQQQYMEKLLNRKEKCLLPQKRSPKQQLQDLYNGCDDFAMSLFFMTIPFVRKPLNYIFGIMNFFLPGIGTILATICGKNYSNIQIIIGLFQLFTSIILIGWLFSIAWGFQIILKPYTDHRKCCRQMEHQIGIELQETIVRAITIGQTGEKYKKDRVENQNQINEEDFMFQSEFDYDAQDEDEEPKSYKARNSGQNQSRIHNTSSCHDDHHLSLNRVHQVQQESMNASSCDLNRLAIEEDQCLKDYQAKQRVAKFFISDQDQDEDQDEGIDNEGERSPMIIVENCDISNEK